MADKKTEKMAQFYEECQKKGYTDMHDDVQSLKAKVIATDLGLKYKNIVNFYEEARTCYNIVQKELAESRQQAKIKKQKEAEEKARRAVNGELLLELSDSENTNSDEKIISVYMRPDKTVYCKVNHGNKIEGAPAIYAKKGGALMYTYHPSQAVYTGATVGGITTGGVHYTKESYSTNVHQAGKGYIEAEASGTNITVDRIIISNYTQKLFKRDSAFYNIARGQEIKCYQHTEKLDFYLQGLSLPTLDMTTRMNAISAAADERRISYSSCVGIVNLVGRIIHGDFPPSDEEIYNKACALAEANTSTKLAEAKQLFNSISDYSDAASQARKVSIKYDEVLQHEKEQAILKAEADREQSRKIAKKLAIIVPILLIMAFATGLVLSKIVIPAANYKSAVGLIEKGEYARAAAKFEALGDYEDAAEQAKIAHQKEGERIAIEELYAEFTKACEAFDAEEYEEAVNILNDVVTSSYSPPWIKEAEEKLKESTYQTAISLLSYGYKEAEEYEEIEKAYNLFCELGEYKDSKEYLAQIFEKPLWYKDSKSPSHTHYFEYNEYGLETAYNRNNGKEICKFNDLGQMISDGEYSFEYNEDGLLVRVFDKTVDLRYEYDSYGNICSATNFGTEQFTSTKTIYNTYENDLLVEMAYGPPGDPSTIWDRYSYTYNSSGQLIKEKHTLRENGAEITYKYNAEGQLIKVSYDTSGTKYDYNITYKYGYIWAPKAVAISK